MLGNGFQLKKLLRVLVLCMTALIALWYTGRLLMLLSEYWKRDLALVAQVTQWRVEEISAEEYALEASYTYEFNGIQYAGKTLFDAPTYLNAYAAHADLDQWNGHAWEAWIQESCPSNATLQRKFPTKPLVQALLTFFVFVYFLCVLHLASKDSKKVT